MENVLTSLQELLTAELQRLFRQYRLWSKAGRVAEWEEKKSSESVCEYRMMDKALL